MRNVWQRKSGKRILTMTCLALLSGAAGCSDDYARMNGGLTTASIGLEPSNQDRIIRKRTNGQVATRVRPTDVPSQSFPDDEPLVASAPETPIDSYVAPAVQATELAPVVAKVETSTTTVRRGLTPKSQAVVRTEVKKTVTAPVRKISKPKLAAAGIPVIPAEPKAPGRLRVVGDPLVTGSIKAAKPAAPAVGGDYTVVSGDTVYGLAERYGTSSSAIMSANGLDSAALKIGQTLTIPGANASVAKAPAVQQKAVAPQPTKPESTVAYTPPTAKKIVTASVPRQPEPAAKAVEPVKVAKVETKTSFAWPARGRIVAEFGQRTPKGTNDGIDIGLPVGTAVAAAADGTVLYSGSELEDFGHLVLVRHDNGWVSAYANSSKNLVKRGDKVKRGQKIALSGQSGNAAKPQLHFELRRNSKPVDPSRHLAR